MIPEDGGPAFFLLFRFFFPKTLKLYNKPIRFFTYGYDLRIGQIAQIFRHFTKPTLNNRSRWINWGVSI